MSDQITEIRCVELFGEWSSQVGLQFAPQSRDFFEFQTDTRRVEIQDLVSFLRASKRLRATAGKAAKILLEWQRRGAA